MADAELPSHLLVTGFQSPLTLDLAKRLADRSDMPLVNLDMLPGIFTFVNSWRAGKLSPSQEEADYVVSMVLQILDRTPEDTVFHGSCITADSRGIIADKYAIFVHMGGVKEVVDARMSSPLSVFTKDREALLELLQKHYDSQIKAVWDMASRELAIPLLGNDDHAVAAVLKQVTTRW